MSIMGESIHSRSQTLYDIYADAVGDDRPWDDLSIGEQRGWRGVAHEEHKLVEAIEHDCGKQVAAFKFEMLKMVPERHYTGVVAALRTCQDILERLVVTLETAMPDNDITKDGRIILGGLNTIIEFGDMRTIRPAEFEYHGSADLEPQVKDWPRQIKKQTRTWYE